MPWLARTQSLNSCPVTLAMASSLDLAYRLVNGALDIGKTVASLLGAALAQGLPVLERILQGVLRHAGPIGAAIDQFIDWAKHVGDAALAIVGGGLTRAGQTVDAILLWVEKDFVTGLRAVIRGMLAAAPRGRSDGMGGHACGAGRQGCRGGGACRRRHARPIGRGHDRSSQPRDLRARAQ